MPDQEPETSLDAGTTAWREAEAQLRALFAQLPRLPGSEGEPDSGSALQERREQARRLSDALAALTAEHPTSDCRIAEHLLPEAAVPGPRRPVLRIYEPWDATGPSPAQLFLHGGGFLFGSSRESVNDAVLAARTLRTGIRHLSLDYALAPEHPFPIARDQVIRALSAVRERADQFGIDPTRLGLGGNSAGASIAASAAVEISRRGGEMPHHLLLEVPAVSVRTLGHATADQRAEMEQLLAQYAPSGGGDAFVADAPDLPPLPPLILALSEHDPLRAGGELLARRVRAAGGEVREIRIPGTLHGSPGATAISTAARTWQEALAGELVDLCSSAPSPVLEEA